MSRYSEFNLDGLKEKGAEFSAYQQIVNQDPFEWTLQDVEVLDDKTRLVKTVKSMKLAAVYFLLDAIYSTYDTEIQEIRLVGKAIIVTVRLITIDKDGVRRCRDGSGFVDASEGVRNATSIAEANAVKNAAKKLGRVFGRDLYADDEPKKLDPKTTNREEVLDEREEPVIQVGNEGVNPVYTSILKQIKGVGSPDELKRIGANVMRKVEQEELDGAEFSHLTDLINEAFNKFKKANNGKAQAKQGNSKSKVPVSLPRRPVNRAANKGGQGGGKVKQDGAKTTRQSGNRNTNKTTGGGK